MKFTCCSVSYGLVVVFLGEQVTVFWRREEGREGKGKGGMRGKWDEGEGGEGGGE